MLIFCIAMLLGCDPNLFARPISVEIENHTWSFTKENGTRDFVRRTELALRSDGSFAQRVRSTSGPVEVEQAHLVWDGRTGTLQEVRHENRAVLRSTESCGKLLWLPSTGEAPVPDALKADGVCAESARDRLGDFRRIGDDRIAGFDVVRYRGVLRHSNVEAEVALAPRLNCASLEVMTRRLSWHPPEAYWAIERVTKIQLGEPNSSIFRVPKTYSVWVR